jgi:uncharacterized phage infection (PIP) family protein YhgE
MRKMHWLLLCFLLAVGCAAGYLFLTEKIIAGQQKIAAGQKQLEEGQQMLAKGKGRLASGSQSLSNAKGLYNGINSVPLMNIVNKLPISSDIFKIAKGRIDEGNSLVVQGNEKIQSGEKQLAEGKIELKRGERKLRDTNGIRIGLAVGGIFFGIATVMLGFCWRKELFKFRHARK